MAYKNPEDAKAANRRWRLANAEKNKDRVRRWREANPERVRVTGEEWRKRNREKVLASHRKWAGCNQLARAQHYRTYRLKSRFGLTEDQYAEMLKLQDFKCAACSGDLKGIPAKQRHIDHNHRTGQVRGILCGGCNTALGLLKENAERMRALASYIERHDRDVNSALNILAIAARSAVGPVVESRVAA